MNIRKKTEKLTPRELEILYLIAGGNSNTEIARFLFLSTHTIKALVTSILRKLDAKNRANAVYKASGSGLLKENALVLNNIKSKF